MSASAPLSRWPGARLDEVARLRAIAAARPHLAYCERTIEAPFEVVWSIFGDLECGVPSRSIRITDRDGERLKFEYKSRVLGSALRFDAIYRPGWCVMRSWVAEVGVAATPVSASRTRVAHFEGWPLLGALSHWWFSRSIEAELEQLARLCQTAASYSGVVQETKVQDLRRWP
jgi:hypothetical protein